MIIPYGDKVRELLNYNGKLLNESIKIKKYSMNSPGWKS